MLAVNQSGVKFGTNVVSLLELKGGELRKLLILGSSIYRGSSIYCCKVIAAWLAIAFNPKLVSRLQIEMWPIKL